MNSLSGSASTPKIFQHDDDIAQLQQMVQGNSESLQNGNAQRDINTSDIAQLKESVQENSFLIQLLPKRTLTTETPTSTTIVYEDPYIRLRWNGTEKQLQYQVKINPTGGWVCGGQNISAGGIISTTSGVLTDVTDTDSVLYWYFSPSGIRDTAFDVVLKGSRVKYWLVSRQKDVYPLYNITVFMGGASAQYKLIVEVN